MAMNGVPVCCLPNGVAPSTGSAAPCCAQNGLDLMGRCQVASNGTSSGTVGSCAGLQITPNPIGFTNVPEGSSATKHISIANPGPEPVSLTCVSLDSLGQNACGQASGLFAFLQLTSFPVSIPPAGSIPFTLEYTASGGTSDADTLDVTFQPAGASPPWSRRTRFSATRSSPPARSRLRR